MVSVIHIQNPSEAPSSGKPQWRAFFSMGFRPLYPAGALWAALAAALWTYAPQWLNGLLSGMYWHAHEMLWGSVGTIAVGFLLTAAATWTGHNPMRGAPLAFMALLWLIARIGYLVGGLPAFLMAGLAETIFFLFSATALMRVMIRGKSRRNLGIPFLVAGLGLSHALFLWAVLAGDHLRLMHYFGLGLICMALIALLVARRVIPFFAMRAVPKLQIPMLTRLGQLQLVLTLLAVLLLALEQTTAAAPLLCAVGLASLYQAWRWKPWAVRGRPILWVLYLGYTFLGLGLIAAAAHFGGVGGPLLARLAAPVHIIGMGGFGLLIIGMITRTALGHMGRPLALDGSMVASYWLVLAATLLRLAALLPTPATLPLLHSAAGLWVLAFVLYLWRFLPMLLRPSP